MLGDGVVCGCSFVLAGGAAVPLGSPGRFGSCRSVCGEREWDRGARRGGRSSRLSVAVSILDQGLRKSFAVSRTLTQRANLTKATAV